MKKISNSIRTRLNLLTATTIAFAFGLGLASALDLTPVSVAATDRRGPEWVIGAPNAPALQQSSGFAEVVERASPAVATIYLEGERSVSSRRMPFQLPPGFFDEPQEPDQQTEMQRWSGSGFIVSSDGYVVTNNHVVADADRVDIELADGQRFNDVELVGRDPQTDVALLKIDTEGLTVLPIGSSDDTSVGEWVLAIGSPGFSGLRQINLSTSVTAGIVSAKGRNIDILRANNQLAIEDFIQTDAVINRGNSGGPLVNASGEVIGINTAILSQTGSYQGYGFAIPMELAREVIDDLIEFGEVRRALIGVSIMDVSAADAKFYGLERVAGALVQSFSGENSPAERAGIELGDVIVGVEGQDVSGVSDLQRRIRAYEPGETVTLNIVRRSTRKKDEAQVRLIDAADQNAIATAPTNREQGPVSNDPLGVEVLGLDELSRSELREYGITPDLELSGVIIVDSDRNGAFSRLFPSGAAGYVITDINGQNIDTLKDYEDAVTSLKPGDAVSIMFKLRPPGGGDWPSQIASIVIPEQ